MSEKPWWRRLDGLPPSIERRRARPLRPVEVWLARAKLLFAPLVAIAMILLIAGFRWLFAAALAVFPLFSVWSMPDHQRRQVLSVGVKRIFILLVVLVVLLVVAWVVLANTVSISM